MEFGEAVNRMYYHLSVIELKYINGDYYNKISYNSLLYIDVIYNTPNCTVSLLADMIGVTKSAVTIKVNDLIKLDLVEKERSKNDRRVYYLRVTEQIDEIYKKYFNIYDSIGENMRKKYTDEEMKKFCSMLSEISLYNWKGGKNE